MDTPQPVATEQPSPSPTRNILPAIKPVTAVIIAAALPATFWSWTHPDDAFRALYASGFDLWSGSGLHALITSALLHGDFLHLVFNLYWLWILGSFLEHKVGSPRFALLALGSAFLSSVAELAWSGEMGIGLSGVVYAIFGVLLVRRRHDPDTASVLPIGRVCLFIGWLILCIVLTSSGIMPVANAAHAVGLLAGLWYGTEKISAFPRLRPALGVLALASAIGILFWAPWHEHWHLARLARMEQTGRDANFHLAALEFAHRFPDNAWGMEYEIWDAKTNRNHERVAELYERMIVIKRDANTLNSLAWLRATCPEPALRDGAEAVKLAREACDLTDWKRHDILNTLAAAYAEIGRFDEAIATNEKAITIAPASDLPMLLPHTEAFQAGRAWREEPTPTTP